MVKQRMPKLRHPRLRKWKRTKVFTFILCLFGVTQIAFVITWHNYAPTGKRKVWIRHEERNKKGPYAIVYRNRREFQGTSEELSNKLEAGFGGQIMIEYSDSNSEENNITFNYAKASFPKKIEFSSLHLKYQVAAKPAYVRVYAKYWEQMTMNLRSLLSLAGQAKLGGRKVVEPGVLNSGFGREGHSLGIYFDLNHFKNILVSSDYATFASQDEYARECLLVNASHVIIHFLYPQKGVEFTKGKLKMNDEEYNDISERASESDWIECPALSNYITDAPNSKQYCVKPTKITEWEKLEKDVIKGAKCLTISLWRGIGGGFRTYFTETQFKIKSRDVQFALKPARGIVKEVRRFTDEVLRERYIAIQVRGERVVIPHNLDRLRSCLRLLAEVVSKLKERSEITQVFVASDMSNFGSGSWKGSLKDEIYDDYTLLDLHNFLISSIDGIEYTPTANNVDRGVVALVEMTIIARAQHLITIGSGSFQEWIRAKFLEQHRDDEQLDWSLITMCSK